MFRCRQHKRASHRDNKLPGNKKPMPNRLTKRKMEADVAEEEDFRQRMMQEYEQSIGMTAIQRLPLHDACLDKDIRRIQSLLELSTIDVNVKDALDETPLLVACRVACSDAILDLLYSKGADVLLANRYQGFYFAYDQVLSFNVLMRIILPCPFSVTAACCMRLHSQLTKNCAVAASSWCGSRRR